jgi:hypothetical protein
MDKKLIIVFSINDEPRAVEYLYDWNWNENEMVEDIKNCITCTYNITEEKKFKFYGYFAK